MMKAMQAQLFEDAPKAAKNGGHGVTEHVLAQLDKLPPTWVRVEDVAAIMDCATATVLAWLDEGLVGYMDIGSGGREFRRVYKPSLVEFVKRRTGEQL